MTKNTDRSRWSLEEQAEHQLKLAEQRRQWEQERKQRKEAERVAGLKQEMEAYREERLTDWMEHGGDPAAFSQVWPSMMKDYLDGKALERQLERQAKLEESIERGHSFQPGEGRS
jgi:hypothetical protein